MFINLRPGASSAFFEAEVSDANGYFHTIGGVYGPTIEKAAAKFEKTANEWDTFDTTPEKVKASTDALLADIAIWGCE